MEKNNEQEDPKISSKRAKMVYPHINWLLDSHGYGDRAGGIWLRSYKIGSGHNMAVLFSLRDDRDNSHPICSRTHTFAERQP